HYRRLADAAPKRHRSGTPARHSGPLVSGEVTVDQSQPGHGAYAGLGIQPARQTVTCPPHCTCIRQSLLDAERETIAEGLADDHELALNIADTRIQRTHDTFSRQDAAHRPQLAGAQADLVQAEAPVKRFAAAEERG